MFTNRFSYLLVALALVAIVALTAQEAIATRAIAAEQMDSATRSYTGWAKAVEAERAAFAMDSATRSYTAMAKAAECGISIKSFDVDSATRSYISWAKALECGTY